MSLPVRVRLTAWYVLLLGMILIALGAFLTIRLRADLVQGVDHSLDSRAAQISLGFTGKGEGEFQDVSDASLVGLPRGESAAQLLSPAGAVLETSGDASAKVAMVDRSGVAAALRGANVRLTAPLGRDHESFRVLAAPISLPGGKDVMVVATSLEDINSSVSRLVVLLLVGGPIALALAALGGWAIARKAFRPVSVMTKKAAEIGADRLQERIDVPSGSDELARLAETLNGMLARLELAADEHRRFIADASHELRTPLAIMASELDVDLRSTRLSADARETLESARDEVDRMARIVEDLLILAQIDEGRLDLRRRPVELRPLIDRVVDDLRPLALERAVRIQVDCDGEVVEADEARLAQVITNLIENGIKYTDSGGRVVVEVLEHQAEVTLRVTDTGPGIPREVLPRIFDRFFRADTSRSRAQGGSGLGLAIAQAIVQAHGGSLTAESNPGRGSSFSIALPLTAGPPARSRPVSG